MLRFGGHFVFWQKKWRRAIMNYHAKFGASSLKIDWIMLNLIFVGHFIFWRPFCFWRPFLCKNMRRVNKCNNNGKKSKESDKVCFWDDKTIQTIIDRIIISLALCLHNNRRIESPWWGLWKGLSLEHGATLHF